MLVFITVCLILLLIGFLIRNILKKPHNNLGVSKKGVTTLIQLRMQLSGASVFTLTHFMMMETMMGGADLGT